MHTTGPCRSDLRDLLRRAQRLAPGMSSGRTWINPEVSIERTYAETRAWADYRHGFGYHPPSLPEVAERLGLPVEVPRRLLDTDIAKMVAIIEAAIAGESMWDLSMSVSGGPHIAGGRVDARSLAQVKAQIEAAERAAGVAVAWAGVQLQTAE